MRLITSDSYWKFFSSHFQAARNVVTTKFEEINSVRNALAHFRPIRTDDLDTVKLSSKHVLGGVADTLNNLVTCRDTVPTNSSAVWYTELRALGTTHCALRFAQSADEQWYRIDLRYEMPAIFDELYPGYFIFTLPNLHVPALLKEFSSLATVLTYATEEVGWVRVNQSGEHTPFVKTVSFGFGAKALSGNSASVKSQLEELLSLVEKETELIQNDSLARGRILRPTNTYAMIESDKKDALIDRDVLTSGLRSDDPVEWWGAIYRYLADFVSAAQTYPWMPTPVGQKLFD